MDFRDKHRNFFPLSAMAYMLLFHVTLKKNVEKLKLCDFLQLLRHNLRRRGQNLMENRASF
jgi:hypothetical protein